jgi:adenylosuccinate synthase
MKSQELRGNGVITVQEEADLCLYNIIYHTAKLEELHSEYLVEIKKVTQKYSLQLEAFEAILKSSELALIQTMKFNKKILFDGTDVVNLSYGSLIHNIGYHVSIPKTALVECEKQGFDDVIKIVKSLDRDAIEKWPDAKLVLIGAERKKKEEFKYTIKG